MHAANEFGHEDVDVLSKELVWGVLDELSDFGAAVFDDADV